MIKRGLPPSHPGEILKGLYVEPTGLTVGAVAEKLGVSRKTLSLLLNGRQGISGEMALRLGKLLGTTPEMWMNLQLDYDLWQARQNVDLSGIRKIRSSKVKSEEL